VLAHVVHGATGLEELGDRLDELHRATAAPVTARRPWLQAWVDSYPDHAPVAIVVEGAARRLDAAALLAWRRRHGLRELVGLGDGPSDKASLPARDPPSGKRLAHAVATYLAEQPRPWRLAVRHLPKGDPVAGAIAVLLPHARVAPGDVSPVLRIGSERALRAYVSRNHHQQVRRMLNRLRRDGLYPDVTHVHHPDAVAAALPEVVAVCRARDVAVGRRSLMDDPHAGAFFRRVVGVHACRGEVQLTTLRLEGRLAAYVLCFLDGDACRMWNCRFDPTWSQYGVGRIANNAALERAVGDGCRTFDWMRGEETYKSSLANDRTVAADLLAWSGPVVRVTDTVRRAKEAAWRVEASGPAGARAVGVLRTARARARRR
jgi:CelD/BcsL family acetyltransferase involved in cellulose biosynthesis